MRGNQAIGQVDVIYMNGKGFSKAPEKLCRMSESCAGECREHATQQESGSKWIDVMMY